MMGLTVPNLDVPVIKGTSGILAVSKRGAKIRGGEVCLRCGKCVDACPMHLMPLYLKEAAKADDYDRLIKLNVNDCMECGSCSFVCPGANNPAQSIRIAKTRLRSRKS